jgi:hypothetical protein
LTRSIVAASAGMTTLFSVVPNEYVTGGLGACLPFRSAGLYFTPMMKLPVEGSVPVAVPSEFTVTVHFSTLQVLAL